MDARFNAETVDYQGRIYRDFHARRDPASGPGWYVFGRSVGGEYGGRLVMLCARPSVPARAHPHYNVKVRRGWRAKREAEHVAHVMNATYPAVPTLTPTS